MLRSTWDSAAKWTTAAILFLFHDIGDQFPVTDVTPVEAHTVAAIRNPGRVAGVGKLVEDGHLVAALVLRGARRRCR